MDLKGGKIALKLLFYLVSSGTFNPCSTIQEQTFLLSIFKRSFLSLSGGQKSFWHFLQDARTRVMIVIAGFVFGRINWKTTHTLPNHFEVECRTESRGLKIRYFVILKCTWKVKKDSVFFGLSVAFVSILSFFKCHFVGKGLAA